MPLTPEEKSEAIALAKGMLLSQRDGRSLANSLISNPHFSSVPHNVKLEALREYARRENQGEYRTTVNMEPTREDMFKSVAREALESGAVAVPVGLGMGLAGSYANLTRDMLTPDKIIVNHSRISKTPISRYARKLAPLTGTLFLSNALIGGVSEARRQKALKEEAKQVNAYLAKVRETGSDEDLTALLFKAKGPAELPGKAGIKTELSAAAAGAHKNIPGAISAEDFTSPEGSYPSRKVVESTKEMERDLDKWTTKSSAVTVKKQKSPQVTLRNIKSSPTFKQRSAKIRKDQMKTYGESFRDDVDAQFRMARAALKRLLRIS